MKLEGRCKISRITATSMYEKYHQQQEKNKNKNKRETCKLNSCYGVGQTNAELGETYVN